MKNRQDNESVMRFYTQWFVTRGCLEMRSADININEFFVTKFHRWRRFYNV